MHQFPFNTQKSIHALTKPVDKHPPDHGSNHPLLCKMPPKRQLFIDLALIDKCCNGLLVKQATVIVGPQSSDDTQLDIKKESN